MKKGFTLIELLVVVLIIGILSAVALPQYQKAVNRAKAAEAWALGKAFMDAGSLYLLETGGTTDRLEDLPIEIPTELKNWDVLTGGGVHTEDMGSAWIEFSGKGSLEGVVLTYHFNRSAGSREIECSPADRCQQMMPCSNLVLNEIGTSLAKYYCSIF